MTEKWLTFLFLFVSLTAFSRADTTISGDSLIIVGKITFSGNKIPKTESSPANWSLKKGIP